MRFAAFLPEGKIQSTCLWLSGLTCNEENFITKAGAQKKASDLNMALFCPDTSPRGLDLPGEHDSYDFGSGAGFYVDARTPGYSDHYRMQSYLIEEFIPLIQEEFKLPEKLGLMGHSMGGHGALTLGLKNPHLFSSLSAFSPIVNPIQAPWGQKALSLYLGDNKDLWREYDTCELLKMGKKHPKKILVDQGLDDEFYPNQLLTENFIEACNEADQDHQVNRVEGFDHSYYFIASFIDNHLEFHS
ncbi:MAG: S-formylglutathione hydrolase [Pseudomonadota bacterium]